MRENALKRGGQPETRCGVEIVTVGQEWVS